MKFRTKVAPLDVEAADNAWMHFAFPIWVPSWMVFNSKLSPELLSNFMLPSSSPIRNRGIVVVIQEFYAIGIFSRSWLPKTGQAVGPATCHLLCTTNMEGPLKELAKLEKLTDKVSVKGKSPSISDSLDSLLQSLHDVKDRLHAGTQTQDTFGQLAVTVEARKKEIEDKQKEIYSSLSRFGKSLDKVRAMDCW
jgi:hypothetical protein